MTIVAWDKYSWVKGHKFSCCFWGTSQDIRNYREAKCLKHKTISTGVILDLINFNEHIKYEAGFIKWRAWSTLKCKTFNVQISKIMQHVTGSFLESHSKNGTENMGQVVLKTVYCYLFSHSANNLTLISITQNSLYSM